jgi:polysaccharide export outer membrane protein
MHLKKAIFTILACCVAAALSATPQPQQSQQSQQSQRQQGVPAPSPVRHPADIVSDNLDRVAATADQILEVLNKDSGLMVEFKRQLAQDAGASGQILEESDLSDVVISERLRQDLRTRVLATRLLQRYGYLLPKINPESDLALEHNLAMRERAQAIQRAAAERHDAARETLPEEGAANCDASRAECPPAEVPARRGILSPAERLPEQEQSARPLQRAADGELDGSRPDTLSSPSELRTDFSLSGAQEGLQAAVRQGSAGTGIAPANRGASGIEAQTLLAPSVSPSELASSSAVQPERPMGGTRSNTGYGRGYERGAAERSGTAAEFESVRMERRPNPYADVPSLYDLYVQAASPNRKIERFGLDLFRRTAADPDVLPMDLPVGPDYIVGPGDSLSINLWGGVSQRLLRTVDREGRLTLPEAGPLLVSGHSLGDVQQEVQRVMRTQFRDVSADVSLLRLRTVRVYVVGDVASPGAYDISSLSTPLNALFAAGGVTPRGSLRRLEHYRGKQLLEEVDAYDLLLHGIRGELKRIENGDSLRVPSLGPIVTVDGMVRRPAMYEIRGEKTLSEVLELAGGILPAATLHHIEVQRLEAHEKRTMLSLDMGETSDKDALRAALEKFTVQDGDEIHIFPIAPYNESAIYLQGHVLRPGRYSYHEGMKLTDLIPSYKDLLPEPAGRYAEIIRISAPDNRPVVQGFDLTAAFAHPENAPKLQALDTIRIFGRYDFEPAPEVLVTGEVTAPGRYKTNGQQHLRDAIYQAGGVTAEAWLDSAQLFRAMPDGSTKVFNISLRDALAGEALNNILVEPRDRILIHRQPEKVDPPSVYVRGDVARPGRYPLGTNMSVSDLVRSAGGLLRSANSEGGDLTHYTASRTTPDSTSATGDQKVNLAAALQGETAEDLPLRDGDVLTVPQQASWKDIGASVTIRGEIGKPGVYGIRSGERLSSLLRRAGGLLPTAYPQAAVFERVSVHEMQQKSRQELIQRMEQESTVVKTAITTSGSEEAALQQAAMQQRQRVLDGLRKAPVSGRLVIHLRPGQKGFEGSPDDIELRAGDRLEIPKQPGFVLIVGQVYNSNAITYTPGKNAGWYLSRAGGATQLANKKAIFIVRANGSVSSGDGGMWSGGVLSAGIGPGDTIVVPEKAVMGSSGWKNFTAIAQIAEAGAVSAAVALR